MYSRSTCFKFISFSSQLRFSMDNTRFMSLNFYPASLFESFCGALRLPSRFCLLMYLLKSVIVSIIALIILQVKST